MKRLPKNVRNGRTIQQCRDYVARYCDQLESIKGIAPLVQVSSFNHGRDICGNGTAHYQCTLVWPLRCVGPTFDIVESGYKREQVGYSGRNEAALWALEKLGFVLDTSKPANYDYQGTAYYPVLNWFEA